MPSSMPVAPKPRPYRRFLTSALHARFVRAATITFACNLLVAGLSTDFYGSIPSFFWAFFPFGKAGVKALLFSASSLLILLLQIATFKMGARCTPSNWTSIRTEMLSYSTYTTVLWYTASAWWFCEVIVFTAGPSSNLGWIINGGYGAPDKLNERPIYLRLFFILLGVVQAGMHVYFDYSSLPPEDQNAVAAQSSVIPLRQHSQMIPKVKAAGTSLITVTLVTPWIYKALFRKALWSSHIWWARAFANIARSDATPPKGYYIGNIVFYAAFWGGILSLSWQSSILLFDYFMLREPLKEGRPLSAASKDPNGTLLTGLTAKRQLVSTFAFWELYIIAKIMPERRKSIFADFERPSSPPVFTSMLNAALEVLRSIELRMKELDPPPAVPSQAVQGQPDTDLQHLPRILPNAVPARGTIYQSTNPAGKNFFAREAQVIGNSPNPWSPPLERGKQIALEYSSPTIKNLQSRAEEAQQSPIGRYLLSTPTRLIKSAILGTPAGNPARVIYAVQAITEMLLASLSEDTFGKAVQGVPPTVQTFTKTIFAIEGFVNKHTNGGFVAPSAAKELEHVVSIHKILQSSLRELLSAFQMFLSDVGLSIRDLNEARKAAEQRDLFREVKSAPASGPRVDDRVTDQKHTRGSQREMEQVDSDRSGRGRQQQEQQTQRTRSQQEKAAVETDGTRPGRLFAQLDQGSSYQASLRERRKSIGQGQVSDINPLIAARGKGGKNGDNPFGARDFNTLPAGGLRRQKVSEVR